MPRFPTGLPFLVMASFAFLTGTSESSAQASSERDVILEWANQTISPLASVAPGGDQTDLEPLRDMIGDAAVVALSEAVHGGAEPLLFRNRLFEFLVEEMGFTAIAIESGIVEGRVVNEYVSGGAGELSQVVADGVSWTFDQCPQNATLIQWLRNYNSEVSEAGRINFYGFDVAGSPGNHFANRGVSTALDEALRYLAVVDPSASEGFSDRLAVVAPNLEVNFQNSDGPGYNRLSQADRDLVTSVLNDIIALIERREAHYVPASSAEDYRWGLRAAIAARQTDNWLRQIPLGWDPSMGMAFLGEAHEVRDRAQLENLEWVIDQEGPNGKVLVFASRFHLSAAPVSSPRGKQDAQVLGTYLERRLGDRLVTIGNLVGGGTVGCGGFQASLDDAPETTLDGLARDVGLPLYLLDLRSAPRPVERLLAKPWKLSVGSFELADGRAFDIFLYMDRITPADAPMAR